VPRERDGERTNEHSSNWLREHNNNNNNNNITRIHKHTRHTRTSSTTFSLKESRLWRKSTSERWSTERKWSMRIKIECTLGKYEFLLRNICKYLVKVRKRILRSGTVLLDELFKSYYTIHITAFFYLSLT